MIESIINNEIWTICVTSSRLTAVLLIWWRDFPLPLFRETKRERERTREILLLMIFSCLWHILQIQTLKQQRHAGMMPICLSTDCFQVYFCLEPLVRHRQNRQDSEFLDEVNMGAKMKSKRFSCMDRPWSVLTRNTLTLLQCVWINIRTEKYLMPTAVHRLTDSHLPAPPHAFHVTAWRLFYEAITKERAGDKSSTVYTQQITWADNDLENKSETGKERERERTGKLWDTLPSFRKWYAGFTPFQMFSEEKRKNLFERKSGDLSEDHFHMHSLSSLIDTQTHTRGTHAFKCANRRHKSSDGQMGNSLPKFTVTWSSVEFPNVKNHKGVSNFLVMLSSSSTHCWVNIRELGEEKKTGRKEERGANENEGKLGLREGRRNERGGEREKGTMWQERE